jgi:hypothetical protein
MYKMFQTIAYYRPHNISISCPEKAGFHTYMEAIHPSVNGYPGYGKYKYLHIQHVMVLA